MLDGHSLNTGFEVFVGGSGRDRLSGNGGEDRFLERGDGTGGDVISGGAGNDVLEYGFTLFNTRTRGVRVSLDGIADDGAPGEGDNVRGDIEDFFLTPHADTLIGSGLKEIVSALEGDDFIDGRGGSDKIDCDAGRDTALLYPGDVRSGCESVGTFRLSPRQLRATAGEPAELTLTWTHPVIWNRLADVRLVLEDRGRAIGHVVFDQETRKLSSRGGVAVARRAAQVQTSADRKRVTVRLAVRIARRYAGRTLTAKLGARADDGTTQAPERAGAIRVRR